MRSDPEARSATGRALAAHLAAALLLALPAGASAFTVFACGPEWAALARVLVPDAVIHAATHARQDPHHIEARPALIAQLRSADLAVCTGAALETGWLPMLQQRAGNPRVQDGAAGMLYAADHAVVIDVQPDAATGPWAGDVHAQGNPHLHADPRRVAEVAEALALRLQALRPVEAAAIAQRHARFQAAWAARMADWQRRIAPWRGQRVAAQHTAFAYLWHWLGVQQVADLEPRPGMAPTPGHLQRVLGALRAQPPAAIVVAWHQDARPSRWLASQLAAPLSAAPAVPVLELPATVPDPAAPDALGMWFEHLVQALEGVRR